MPPRVRAPGANVTDETRQEAIRALAASYNKLKTAQSSHATECKKWQGAGIKTPIAMKVIRERFKDADVVLAELHEEIRMRALTDIPTIQDDLTALWSPPSVSDEAAAEQARWQWREAGALAARNGHARDANPHPPGLEAHAVWDDGWLHSPERIAAEMAAGGAPTVDTTPRSRRRRVAAPVPPAAVAGNGATRRRRAAL